MSENEERKPGFYRASPEEIPPYQVAIAQYQDPAKQSLIGNVKSGNDLQWDHWKATIEYSRRDNFDGILDFFVNLPSLQDDFADELVTGEWYWREIEPATLDSEFYYRPELMQLLRSNAGSDAMITAGWLVKSDAGRIDTETTWSDNSYLIGTNGYFAYIQLYRWIIH